MWINGNKSDKHRIKYLGMSIKVGHKEQACASYDPLVCAVGTVTTELFKRDSLKMSQKRQMLPGVTAIWFHPVMGRDETPVENDLDSSQ